MEPSVERTCSRCHENMIISMKNLNDKSYLKRQNKYYHTACFIEDINERVMKNGRYSLKWQMELDKIEQYEKDARDSIELVMNRDKLNEYLIETYNVTTLSKQFWLTITDIGNGVYKNKKCKAINVKDLFETWKYAQRGLDRINRKRKAEGKDITDEQRVRYDLAIVFKDYNKIQKSMAKAREKELEKALQASATKIDYDNLATQAENKQDGIGDISDIMDEFF